MEIIVATDHAGFSHKEAVKAALVAKGYTVTDCGALQLDASDDYPDFIVPAMEKLLRIGGSTKAVIFGGSGQGEAMLANKFRSVRAVVYYGGNTDIISLSREHNDANVLSIGARFMSEDEAVAAVTQWLEVDFSQDERHVRRLQKFKHAH